jgi:hypothetical protein
MDSPRNMRSTSLLIRAMFAALCVLVIPKLALGEPDAPGHQQTISGKPSKRDPFIGGGRPMHLTSRLFPDSDDCAVAKVDIWLQRGLVTYSTFVAGKSPAQVSRSFSGGADGTTVLIGEKDCLVRVRIERATDASVYDWDQVKRLRDAVEKAQ